jgi:glycosyltransferase involved in cell wall biosynthesis
MSHAGSPLRVVIVLPRNMSFGERHATAIDLCVHDLVAGSRFGATTTVFGEPVEAPFPGTNFRPFQGTSDLLDKITAAEPDVILVEQHRPTAALIARSARAPVVLHRHGLHKARGWLARWRTGRDLRRMAGIVAVSEAVAQSLAPSMPCAGAALRVIHNGLDFRNWHPATPRASEIIFVGRLAPEKGVIESAHAVARVLTERDGWRARFILADPDVHPTYRDAVMAVLGSLGARVTIAIGEPHAVVRRAFERAAIALVPSKWAEPFGRTALEAFAGGAALITSGRGGLAEITGGSPDIAVTVPDVSSDALAAAILALIDDPERRDALAEAARRRGQREFDIAVAAHRLDEFLAEIVAARRRSMAG